MNELYSLGAQKLKQKLEQLKCSAPGFHVVLGSGFKDALTGMSDAYRIKGEILFSEVPGLSPSTAPGHSGKFVVIEHLKTKKTGMIQVGRLHGYEGLDPKEVVRPLLYTRELGTDLYFITNAAGGIDPAHRPGDVMLITDHINLTGKNPLVGENPKRVNGTEWGPRFPDLTKLYDRTLRQELRKKLIDQKLTVHEGVYMGVLGPSFETPAEVRFFRQCGTHSVGMSTVWETIALKHSGATLCGLSLISNVAAGLSEGPDGELEELDHFSILDACKSSSTAILRAILDWVDQKNAI